MKRGRSEAASYQLLVIGDGVTERSAVIPSRAENASLDRTEGPHNVRTR